jgi:hypothetical protein
MTSISLAHHRGNFLVRSDPIKWSVRAAQGISGRLERLIQAYLP